MNANEWITKRAGLVALTAAAAFLLAAPPVPREAADTRVSVAKAELTRAAVAAVNINEKTAPAAEGGSGFSAIVEKVMPSLVKVENDGLFGHPALTGHENEIQIAQTSEGSGFFIDGSGLILTNHHVVEGAQGLRVHAYNRKTYPAEVVGSDPVTDIAIIRIKPDFTVVPVRMGDSDALKVGQWVLAMGNPLGLEFFTSAGIISGFGPPGPDYDGFMDFIQADVNIEPGHSGGPMLDDRGAVIGINNAYMGPGTGIGFAIPIDRAKEVVAQLKTRGSISRGFMGVVSQPLNAELAKMLGVGGTDGALISDVAAGSPAHAAGIRKKDVIVGVDGRPVADDHALQERVFQTPGGTSVKVALVRDGREMTLPVKLGEYQADRPAGRKTAASCGLNFQKVPERLARKLGLTDASGLIVLRVVPGCPAFEGGLRFGDVVKEIEGAAVKTEADFYRVYTKPRPDRQVLVRVIRGGKPLYVAIKQGEG